MPGSLSYVGSLVFAPLYIGTGARRIVDYAGLIAGFELVFRLH